MKSAGRRLTGKDGVPTSSLLEKEVAEPGLDTREAEIQFEGDTHWATAAKILGNGLRCNEIFEANCPMPSHPDKIYPGRTLRIPQDA